MSGEETDVGGTFGSRPRCRFCRWASRLGYPLAERRGRRIVASCPITTASDSPYLWCSLRTAIRWSNRDARPAGGNRVAAAIPHIVRGDVHRSVLRSRPLATLASAARRRRGRSCKDRDRDRQTGEASPCEGRGCMRQEGRMPPGLSKSPVWSVPGSERPALSGAFSTRRGVLTTLWHGVDGPMMSGECCGGVPMRVFPPDGGPWASGCHGAAERRTASLGDGPFRAVRRSGWRRGRPAGGRRSGDWPAGCTGTRRARAQWRWRRCSTPPDCAAGSAPRHGSDPRRR